MDTTIKVDSAIRDRLAIIAREHGTTIRDLVAELASATPTTSELEERAARTMEYLKSRVSADLNDNDVESGNRIWQALETGSVPEVLGAQNDSNHRAA